MARNRSEKIDPRKLEYHSCLAALKKAVEDEGGDFNAHWLHYAPGGEADRAFRRLQRLKDGEIFTWIFELADMEYDLGQDLIGWAADLARVERDLGIDGTQSQ